MRTRVGYTGGDEENPTYHRLGGHTESIEIDYDPEKTSYEALLRVFWDEHQPCHRSWSTQYKAAVFTHDEAQREAAERTAAKIALERGQPVLTEIIPLKRFWRAEAYHQKYRLRSAKKLVAELEKIYPDQVAFTDSTVAMRVNAWLAGYGTREQLDAVIDRLGLSDEAKDDLRARTKLLR